MNQRINQGKSTVTANYLRNIDCQLMQQTLIVLRLIQELVCAPQTGCRTLDHSHRALILTEATQTNPPLLSNKQGENACAEKKRHSIAWWQSHGQTLTSFYLRSTFLDVHHIILSFKNSLQHVKTRCDLFTDTFSEIPTKRPKSQT